MTDETGDQKAKVATAFGSVAATFGQASMGRFTHFGRRLVEAAGLPPGARVLDVAAGRGALLFEAAKRVGATGSVLGVDLSTPMVEATEAEIRRRGVANAQIRVMDAEQLEVESASFDAVLCGFGIMFFPRRERALAEFRRVLRPGGTLAVSTWGAPDPRWEWVLPLLRSYGASDSLTVTRLSKTEELGAVLQQKGWDAVHVRTEEDEPAYADEEAWWDELWSGISRLALERLTPTDLRRLRAQASVQLHAIGTGAGLPRRWQAIFGLATNP